MYGLLIINIIILGCQREGLAEAQIGQNQPVFVPFYNALHRRTVVFEPETNPKALG